VSENRARYPIAVMCRVLDVSSICCKVAVDAIGRRTRLIPHGRDSALAAAHAGQAGAPHQPGDPFATDTNSGIRKVNLKARCSIRAFRGRVRCADSHDQRGVRHGTRRGRPLHPSVIAAKPNMLWVADITYIPTWAGFLYLAVVLDAFSRRIVGWSMATTLHTQVVLDALDMALWQRRPSGVIHHSDQGSQYTSIEFGKRCREVGVRPSMGSVGDAYDNAMAESFFATLECELFDRRRFKTHAEARIAVFEFIEGFYNSRRRHSSLGYLSPIKFECQLVETTLAPGAHEHAVVLAPVKERPGTVAPSRTASVPAVLDSRSTRQPRERARRDEKILSAEPKDRPKEEDRMLSN
jgi:transposase InsO family protein